MAGRNVQETQLICTLRVIGAGEGDGVSGVAQVDEIDALHGAAVFHVEAGDDAGLEHESRVAGKGMGGKGAPWGRCAALRWDFRVHSESVPSPFRDRSRPATRPV